MPPALEQSAPTWLQISSVKHMGLGLRLRRGVKRGNSSDHSPPLRKRSHCLHMHPGSAEVMEREMCASCSADNMVWGGIGSRRQEDQGASANAIAFWRAASCHMAPRPSVWKVSGGKFQTQVVWISLKFSGKLSHILIGKDNLWRTGILKRNRVVFVCVTNYAVILLERFFSGNSAKRSLTVSCAC